jgi:hypothetical protein
MVVSIGTYYVPQLYNQDCGKHEGIVAAEQPRMVYGWHTILT